MNDSLFSDHMVIINDILDNIDFDSDEINSRKEEMISIYSDMKKNNCIIEKFYDKSHEIRCLDFLKGFGDIIMAKDFSHNKNRHGGCDFILNNYFQIECICSSKGDEIVYRFNEYPDIGVGNYNEKERIIFSRLTNSLCKKQQFYLDRVGKSIESEKPYIIFVGLGNLTYGMFNEKYGFEMAKILYGDDYFKNDELVIIKNNKELGEIEVSIPIGLFKHEEYQCVSAVIYSTANLESRYTKENTYIFLNPYAKVEMDVSKFKDIVYWEKSENSCVAKLNGNVI